ncbi:hypothetical protein [Curvivirga sp.]|uniref:hypothetical protein n=1 Tax=Curvivirga sp. TaxID=2856848 RepID=UPI003B59B478
MNYVCKYLRRGAAIVMLSLVVLAGFSASMNILLSHDVTPDMELSNHDGDHQHDFDPHDMHSHKHIHNAADHSHETPVTAQRKPIEVMQNVAKVTFSIPPIPVSNLFYSLDRPPAIS